MEMGNESVLFIVMLNEYMYVFCVQAMPLYTSWDRELPPKVGYKSWKVVTALLLECSTSSTKLRIVQAVQVSLLEYAAPRLNSPNSYIFEFCKTIKLQIIW